MFLAALLTILLHGDTASDQEVYRDIVRTQVDLLLEHGMDTYGPEKLPILMSIIDPRTLSSPESPEVLDGLIRSEGRLHRRNPAGSDLWDDQPLLRVLYTLGEQTEDARYADAANAYIKAYTEHARRPNGLLSWGTHVFYDAYRDAPGGDQDGAGPHEILVLCPQWERMYAVAPEAMRSEIQGIWDYHMVDLETGEHNRHDDRQRGCDFAFSGGEFAYAFAFLYKQTGDEEWLRRAKLVAGRHWNARNPETNLAPDAPATGDRYDAHHCFTTIPGPHAALLLKAFEVSGDVWFRDVALAYINAYLKYGWDAAAGQYHAMLALDGTPVLGQEKGPGYDAWKPTGHVEIWRTVMFSYEFPMAAAQTALYAYTLTQDAGALEAARNWATSIRKELPPATGHRWKAELEGALPEAARLGGVYAENYGRAISFFLSLHYAAGEEEDLATARALAVEAREKLVKDGWVLGHPAKPYYESTDGVAYLLYAFLELVSYPRQLPPNL